MCALKDRPNCILHLYVTFGLGESRLLVKNIVLLLVCLVSRRTMAPKKGSEAILKLRNSLKAKFESSKKTSESSTRSYDEITAAMATTLAEVNGKLDEQAERHNKLREDFNQHAESTAAVFEAMAEVVSDFMAEPDAGEVCPSLSMVTQTWSQSQDREVAHGTSYRDVVAQSLSAASLHDSRAHISPPVHFDAPRRDAILSVIECMSTPSRVTMAKAYSNCHGMTL